MKKPNSFNKVSKSFLVDPELYANFKANAARIDISLSFIMEALLKKFLETPDILDLSTYKST